MNISIKAPGPKVQEPFCYQEQNYLKLLKKDPHHNHESPSLSFILTTSIPQHTKKKRAPIITMEALESI